MSSSADSNLLGPVNAVVERIEHYGLYLREGERVILVLIVDISKERIARLEDVFGVGQSVSVNVLFYVPERGVYKGTMIDLVGAPS